MHAFVFFADATWSRVLDLALSSAQIPRATYSYRRAQSSGGQDLLLCFQVPEFAGDTSIANPCNVTIPIPPAAAASADGSATSLNVFPRIVRGDILVLDLMICPPDCPRLLSLATRDLFME